MQQGLCSKAVTLIGLDKGITIGLSAGIGLMDARLSLTLLPVTVMQSP